MKPHGTSFEIDPTELHRFGHCVLEAVGVPSDHARSVADVLLASDLQGVSTHGFALLTYYVPALQRGEINTQPAPARVAGEGAVGLMDADGALGQLSGVWSMTEAIELARAHGVGLVGVRNSRHWGAASYYTGMAVREGMIGIALSLGAGNCMAPLGGMEYLAGNNPIAIAAPSNEERPPSLDMAVSVTSRSKIVQAAKRGEEIPLTWALDSAGNPTSDADEAANGFLQFIGDYKGYGLSVMISILAGALTGSAIGSEMRPFLDLQSSSGHLVCAIDVRRFREMDDFTEAVDRFLQELKGARRIAGVDEIRVPGQREHETAAERRVTGIAVDEVYIAELDQLADDVGIASVLRAESQT